MFNFNIEHRYLILSYISLTNIIMFIYKISGIRLLLYKVNYGKKHLVFGINNWEYHTNNLIDNVIFFTIIF